ncbi:MAG: dienelactone hydrolase family protein [Rhodospirillales bacterium]|jgi:carboxymethylenebutenolidase|nr:dienelactone hydrolase family protein [Rhodospirillales bacterium]MDP6644682.1 dienelactone hydrolase family protein [Rhodospirillales bacterium]MDP6842537.1 dienelactone hydrolase family protein [Rhodospirillales bacterium]
MGERIVSLHAFYKHGEVEADAYLSHPTAPGPWPAVIVAHEWWGLEEHFRDFSRELASHGMVVLVPDLYHGKVTGDPAEAALLKTSLDIDRAVEEIGVAAAYLRNLPFVSEKVSIVGFCMGGGLALLAASRSSEFSAGVIYFPSIYPDTSELENISCPLQFHYGTADTVTPRSEIDRITRTLDGAGKLYELHLYEGADHAFVNDMHPEHYDQESTQATWPRTVEFLNRHTRE